MSWFCELIKDPVNRDMLQIGIMIAGFGFAFWLINYRDKLLRLRDDEQRMHELQEWFEETYVINGAEALLRYVSMIIFTDAIERNATSHENRANLAVSAPEFPMRALNRVMRVLDSDQLRLLFKNITNRAYRPDFQIGVAGMCNSHVNAAKNLIKDAESTLEGLVDSFRALRINSKIVTYADPRFDDLRNRYRVVFGRLLEQTEVEMPEE